VSRLHAEVSRRIFQPLFTRWPQPEVPISHVTNGVHMPSWDSAEADELWSRACGKDRWIGTLSTVEADLKVVPDETLWALRNEGCRQLIRYVRERLCRQMEASAAARREIREARNALDPRASR